MVIGATNEIVAVFVGAIGGAHVLRCKKFNLTTKHSDIATLAQSVCFASDVLKQLARLGNTVRRDTSGFRITPSQKEQSSKPLISDLDMFQEIKIAVRPLPFALRCQQLRG